MNQKENLISLLRKPLACAKSTFPGLLAMLWMAIPIAVQGQFDYYTNNGTITITGYTGSGGAVTIPDTIDGLPVTSIAYGTFMDNAVLTSVVIGTNVISIGNNAFDSCTNLTNAVISSSVTNIGSYAFSYCTGLTNLFIRKGVINIDYRAFDHCTNLPSLAIPDSVINIGNYAFNYCAGLSRLTIPNSVTNIGSYAFNYCTGLTNVAIGTGNTYIGAYAFQACVSLTAAYFKGNAPPASYYAFYWDFVTFYYLPGTTGWEGGFGGRPTFLWNPQIQTGDASFGVRTNRFGFNIAGTTNIPIVLEACTNLANPTWIPLQSCNLTNGSLYFGDPGWTNYPARLYRIRSP